MEIIDWQGEPTGRGFNRYADTIGRVDRQKLEAEGEVYNDGVHWSSSDHHLYASLEALRRDRYIDDDTHENEPDLRELKAAMADAHPDRGGSSAGFIAARERYLTARRRHEGMLRREAT